MGRYIVTYDLLQPGRNYDDLYERIRSYSSSVRITESSWGIATDQESKEVRDYLKPALDNNDELLVGRLGTSAWTGLGEETTNWLKANR